MEKKIIIGSIVAATIIVLATFTPAICAEELNIEKKLLLKQHIIR